MRSIRSVVALAAFAFACHAPSKSMRSAEVAPSRAFDRPITLRVLVLDGESGAPVSGARVEYVPATIAERRGVAELEEMFLVSLDLEKNRARLVRRVETDAHGFATLTTFDVTRPGSPMMAELCRIDAAYGSKWGAMDPANVRDDLARIVLEPDTSARVLVRSGGRPVPEGTLVGLYAVDPNAKKVHATSSEVDEDWDPDDDESLSIWLGETDPNGAVTLPHVAHYRERLRGEGRAELVTVVDDELGLLTRVPLDDAHDGTVVLELPPSSSVEIEIVDGRGRRVDRGHAQWTVGAKGVADAQLDEGYDRRFVGGRFLIPVLAPGTELAFRASASGWCDERVDFAAPDTPGGRAQVRVVLGRPSFGLYGRLVDEHGRPVANAFFDLEALTSGRIVQTQAGEDMDGTDAEGRFGTELDPMKLAEARGDLVLRVSGQNDADGRVRFGGTLQFEGGGFREVGGTPIHVDAAKAGASIDLGDVVVRSYP